jgi:hypothetical protein
MLSLICNFALEYVIWMVQESREEVEFGRDTSVSDLY